MPPTERKAQGGPHTTCTKDDEKLWMQLGLANSRKNATLHEGRNDELHLRIAHAMLTQAIL